MPSEMGRGVGTDRLLLRPLSRTDAKALHRISNEPPVRRFLWDDEPVSEAAFLDIVAGSERMFSEAGVGLFGVWLRGRGEIIGFCGSYRTSGGSDEIGLTYEISSRLWGRGLATEAAQACLGYAFERTSLDGMVAGVDTPNSASLRVIEKLGMKRAEIQPGRLGVSYFAISRDDFLAAPGGGASG